MSDKYSSEPLCQVSHVCLIDVNYLFTEAVRQGTSYPGAARKTLGELGSPVNQLGKSLSTRASAVTGLESPR